jgi:DNA-binding MarR family transcriptional regulator
VNRLEQDGLVERISPKQDRRVVNVTLTQKGRSQFEDQAKGHEAMINQIFDGLEDADLDQIRDLLRRAAAPEDS